MKTWLGVDVGGKRKGFDAALIDEQSLIDSWSRLALGDVVRLVERHRPVFVAIDSPRSCARPGETTRDGERELARAICRIRWTPDEVRVRAHEYYAWIVEGLALFDALADADTEVIEVFPTASWTRWFGPHNGRSRSAWTRDGVSKLPLAGLPKRSNQDQRDAIAAAVTARLHSEGKTETFGDIVVPSDGSTAF